jgi:hypothetical protein
MSGRPQPARAGREQEEGDCDSLVSSVFGGLGQGAGAGRAPHDDDARGRLDQRVQAEAEQRDRPCCGGGGHGSLDEPPDFEEGQV